MIKPRSQSCPDQGLSCSCELPSRILQEGTWERVFLARNLVSWILKTLFLLRKVAFPVFLGSGPHCLRHPRGTQLARASER